MPTNVDVPSSRRIGQRSRSDPLAQERRRLRRRDEPLAELETDKANVDLPAPAAGVLRRAKDAGETVQVGETIAPDRRGQRRTASQTARRSAAPAPKPLRACCRSCQRRSPRTLSPAVRRIVEENKLDPATDQGSRSRRAHDQGGRAGAPAAPAKQAREPAPPQHAGTLAQPPAVPAGARTSTRQAPVDRSTRRASSACR